MGSSGGPKPAFGEADLSNCEREQIQLAGSIQPHGALLVVSESNHVIIQASANAAAFLNCTGGLIGRPLLELEGNLAERIAPHFRDALHAIPVPVRCELGDPPELFDCLLHRPPEGGLVIELERAGPPVDLTRHVGDALQTIVATPSLKTLCDETATIFKSLTGYDRVMVYRFDDEGHGEVFSEQREPSLEPYLGNHYPASDIPQIARRLYERNRVRVLVNVEYDPVPITPRLSPVTGRDLDMSLCFLRSMSPIHVQYLKNMGVGATLVASIVVGGKLWGLVACHHYEPRFVHFEVRSVCELLAETVATRIAALESFAQAQAELSVRRLEQRMVETIGRDGDWRAALFDSTHSLLQPVGATGAALLFDGQVMTVGDVPATQQLREIGRWLDARPAAAIISTNALPADEPMFAPLRAVASGLIATAISSSKGEYLVWFRPEQVQTVTWGGNPFKPFVIGNDPSELSPRRSFAQWHQLVEGTAEQWTPADLAAARMIGESVTDVIMQFRSVRMLIVQDQLDSVSRDVRSSEQPVVIADARGRILLSNEAFEQLLRNPHRHLEWLDDLPPLFGGSQRVRERFKTLVAERQSWRGEISLESELGVKPVHLRADPILAGPDRLLGFVLLFTDISEQKAVEAARRRLQEGIFERPRVDATRLDAKSELLYRGVLASLAENAQLAALEITDGIDMARMPEMLESVHASFARTAELLERLMHHMIEEDVEVGDWSRYAKLKVVRNPRPPKGPRSPREQLRKP